MIHIHWVHLADMLMVCSALKIAKDDIESCGPFGFPAVGCGALAAAIIASLLLLLAKAWGWV